MGCCGQRRQQLRRGVPATRSREESVDLSSELEAVYPSVYFQFLGREAVTLVGPISGKRYRFAQYGAVVAVDPRDRRSLEAVRYLTAVT